MKRLQAALLAARKPRFRREIAERALVVPGGAEIDEKVIQNHEHRAATPPGDGLRLRTHCAAVGVAWLEALELIDYWPPLLIGAPTVKMELLRDWCKRHGARVEREDVTTGRVVVQL